MRGGMRKLRVSFFPAAFLALLPMCGCWSRQEPNTMAILESALFDETEEGLYSLTMEIFDPSPLQAGAGGGEEGGGKTAVVIVNTVAETIPQAVFNETENLDRKIFTSHTHARFLSEKFASGNISTIMDYFLRNPESRHDPYLVVIKGENSDLLYSCSSGLSDTIGTYVNDMADAQMDTTSEGVFVKTLDYLKDDYLDGKDPVMGCAEIIEDPTLKKSPEGDGESSQVKQYVLQYKGLAAFRDGKLQGFLDGFGARMYNMLTGKYKSAVVNLSFENEEGDKEHTLLNILEAKPDMRVKFQDDKATLEAEVQMKLGITQVSGKTDILNDDVKKKLLEEFSKQMERQFSDILKQTQQMGCDIFGFGVAMHANNPEEWKKIKDKWTDYYRNAEVTTKVEAQIVKTGESKAPFQLEE